MELPPRHQCMIYDGSPSLQLPKLAALTIERLKANSRCLFLNSPAMVAGFRSYLAAAGLDVAREVKRGALVVSSDQSHLTNGRFDVERMLQMLRDALDQALRDGYTSLWATGDMMWEFGSESNLEKLLEYETRLDELLRQEPRLGGICQYHKETLPAQAIPVALYTHPTVFVNETLSRLNTLYQLPETLGASASGDSGAVRVPLS